MMRKLNIILLGGMVCLILLPLAHSQQLEIHCIDVGQGSSELVIGPNGTTILIDGGVPSMGRTVCSYMDSVLPSGSRTLDYVIASHDDRDHYGGLKYIIDSSGYSIGTIYHCGDNSAFGEGVQIPLGKVIELGNGARATCVGRYGKFINGKSGSTSNKNNQSVCLLIEYGGFDYITAGDLETNESYLSTALINYPTGDPYLDPDYGVDVIHVNHHGSDGSSHNYYINRLIPEVALINGGTGYGHPRWTAVDRLKGRTHYTIPCSCNASMCGDPTYVTVPGAAVFRTTAASGDCDRASEEDCPTVGDIVVTYDGRSENYYVEGDAYPVDEPTVWGIQNLDSGDYDGDCTSDVAIFRESSGLWAVKGITRVYFGGEGDRPVSADYDGDETTDMAIFRGASGLWAVRGVTRVYFGDGSGSPQPGDYNGDGTCEVAVYVSSRGLWAARGITRVYFGGVADRPVPVYGQDPGKYFGIFRPSTGLWAIRGITRIYFGGSNDWTVPANYTGDPDTFVFGIFREDEGLWALRGTSRVYFGAANDQPAVGNYRGDFFSRPAIFRESSALWAIRGLTRLYFGTSGDIPISGRVCKRITPIPTSTPTASPTPEPTPTPSPVICTRIDEGFDGFDTGARPSGWVFSNINSTYSTLSNFGQAPPSLRLGNTGDALIETESFFGGEWLQFWMKGLNTDGESYLMVEEYSNGGWSTVTDIHRLPRSGTLFSGLVLSADSTRLRFSYKKSAGNLAVDDVLVKCLITPSPTTAP